MILFNNQNKNKMDKVQEIIRFNQIRERSDAAAIAKLHGFAAVTIYKALQTGTCSDKVFNALKSFYDARAEYIAKLEQEEVSHD